MIESEEASLAKRMLQAFKSPIGCFIFDKNIDNIDKVLKVLKESKALQLLDLYNASREKGIIVIAVNIRSCRLDCIYEVCKNADDKKCMSKCMEDCINSKRSMVIKLLEKYVERILRNQGFKHKTY